MGKASTELRFKLFGDFSAEYGGRELKLDKSGTTKVSQMLAMLIYYKDGVSKTTLLNNLYAETDLMDRNNNLRVTMHKLRRTLKDAGLPDENYITVRNSIYKWTGTVPVSCDVWEFQEAVRNADSAREEENEELELYWRRQACDLYRDEFLAKISYEDWVVVEAIPLKRSYGDCLKRLLEMLGARGEYQEIVELTSIAETIYPYDEWQLSKIDALMAMNRYEEAVAVYQDFSQRYFEDLGLSPTEEMLIRYQEMRGKMQRQYSSADEVYHKLGEEEDAPAGASCVTYSNFIDRYRFLQRISERSGESNFLVVITALLRKTGQVVDTSVAGGWVDEVIEHVLQKSLRKTDTFAKYNESQYVLLLVGINLESVKLVTKRIDQRLSRLQEGQKLQCTYQAMPMRQANFIEKGPGWDFHETGGTSV